MCSLEFAYGFKITFVVFGFIFNDLQSPKFEYQEFFNFSGIFLNYNFVVFGFVFVLSLVIDKLILVALQRVVQYAPKIVQVQRIQEPKNLDLDPLSLNRCGPWSTIIFQTGLVQEPVQFVSNVHP